MVDALFIIHYALVLLYGILLSAAFAGVRMTKGNLAVLGGLFAACGAAQLAALLAFDEQFVWYAYPLLGHLPVVALLCLRYRKRVVTAVAAVAAAYLCCQPAKWAGIFAMTLTGSAVAEELTYIIVLLALGYVALRYAASGLAAVYNKDTRSVLIFSVIPLVYYLFDYSMAVYSDLWLDYTGAVSEFIPFILCLAYLAFCTGYHEVYEQKEESERREQIVRMAVEQQAREVEAVRRSGEVVRMLRHDMRMFLSGLSRCLDEGDLETAQKMLAGYIENVDATAVRRYCDSDIINYVVADYHDRCKGASVRFEPVVKIGELPVDELAFASILSNALDNALNAQEDLPAEERRIKMMLQAANAKLLLVVRNACATTPTFVDDMPMSKRLGHGYGTQSIRYMTERLGGSCQFSASADGRQFVLRVIVEL